MQTALDATALILPRSPEHGPPTSAAGQRLFQCELLARRKHRRSGHPADELAQEGNFTLKITGSGSIDPVFTKLLGQTQLNFSASAEVMWGIKKLNLALALDNTGSMASSGKMTALKTAAHNLLTTLAERGEAARRRQGFDRPVRGRRQCRHRQGQRDLDRLDRMGGRHGTRISIPRTRRRSRQTLRRRPASRPPCSLPSKPATARPR